MQTLTDDAAAILAADVLEVSAGCEVLDLDLNLMADISDELLGGAITHRTNDKIHGTCRLDLSVELQWGAVLVRPYMVVGAAGVDERFNVGVYMLTTPERPIGTTPPIFTAYGFDRLYLLDREVGDDYTIAVGTSYYDALVQVFADAGLSGVDIDGTADDFVLPVEREWTLVASSLNPDQTTIPVTWLRIVNDLLAAINFRSTWCDHNGRYQCQRYVQPAARPTEHTFTADDATVTTIAEDRSVVADMWKCPNRWVFIWSNRPGGESDTEGDGRYTVDNLDDGPTSQTARGLVWTKVWRYEAASQAVLVNLGDRRVALDRQLVTTVHARTSPFPAAGHFDVYKLVDAEIPDVTKVQAIEWEYDLAGGDVEWLWEAVA